ncbi:hypothetical protein Trydic_g19015 [Trypoxylus dichotomus]
MQALEPSSSSSFEITTTMRRRYRKRPIAIAVIRNVVREILSCLSGIFVLKLNFVHTTKTSLNPTNILLVGNRSQPEPRQSLQITELPSETDELPSANEIRLPPSRRISEQLQTGEGILQRMIADKNYALEYIQDGLKSLTERITPALSRFGLLMMAFCVVWHETLTQLIIYPLFRLLFGTLYPAYASYKAVKTKNVREYVKWMMYWIVFALFTCAETFTDVFLSWFPFYYEIKIILVIWLLSPATKGSSILYRKFVHPMLSSREQEIDEYISKAKEQSYKQVLDLGSKGVNALMQTAIKNLNPASLMPSMSESSIANRQDTCDGLQRSHSAQFLPDESPSEEDDDVMDHYENSGGGLVNQIRKSYSLSDLSEQRHEREYEGNEETDSLAEPRVVRRRHSPRRHSPRRHTTTSAIYFSEIDVRHDMLGNIQTVDDISSGYSSGELAHAGHPARIQAREALVRTGSIGSSKLKPTRITRSTVAKKSTEDLEYKLEYPSVTKENIIYLNDQARLLSNLDNTGQSTKMSDSASSEEDFRDCIDHDDDKIKVEIAHSGNEGGVSKVNPLKILKSLEENKGENSITNQGLSTENVIVAQKDNIKHVRGGKYNKHLAPLPPNEKKSSDLDLSAIKATLILKPGVIKSIGLDLAKSEIFCHSPKSKRRSLNVSPVESASSSTSKLSRSPNRSKSRLDASLSRLRTLPRKITFWHRDDSDIPPKSRSSWYDTSESRLQTSKEFSKSDDDVSKMQARYKLLKRIKMLMEEKGKQEHDH